jgi:hypothetical protein
MQFTIDAIILSFWVSVITLGISNASEKGALLYSIKRRFTNKDQKMMGKITKLKEKIKQNIYTAKRNEQYEYVERLEKRIAYLENKELYIGFWKKPLFTCAKCMPSIWSTLFFIICIPEYNLIQLPFVICLSSLINTIWIKTFA